MLAGILQLFSRECIWLFSECKFTFRPPQGTFNNLNPVVADTKWGRKVNDVHTPWCVTDG